MEVTSGKVVLVSGIGFTCELARNAETALVSICMLVSPAGMGDVSTACSESMFGEEAGLIEKGCGL